jgi:hypothetical protein
VVACYCAGCAARVAAGHDRPLFSFTRFERHCGSKAKKWRLSLRIDPGATPECPAGEPPLALGQWLDSKGLGPWLPRASIKVGPAVEEGENQGVFTGAAAAAAKRTIPPPAPPAPKVRAARPPPAARRWRRWRPCGSSSSRILPPWLNCRPFRPL